MPRDSQIITLGGYVPVAVRPSFNSTATFNRAIETLNARSQEALDNYRNLSVILGQDNYDSSEAAWASNYNNSILNAIDKAATFSYADALSEAKIQAARVASDPARLGRLKAHAAHQQFIQSVQSNNKINQAKKDWAIAMNPYHYEDKFDANGNIIEGNAWTPNRQPIDDLDLTKFYAAAKQLVAEESGNNVSVKFMKEDGTLTDDISQGYYGMAYQTNTGYQRVPEAKLREVFNSLFNQYPGAKEAILQDMDVRKWQYDNADDAGKKAFLGSDIMDDKGVMYSPEEYLNHIVNPVLKDMAYNNTSTTFTAGNAYAQRMQEIRAAQKAGQAAKILSDLNEYRPTSISAPIEINMEENIGRAFDNTQKAIQTLYNLFPKATKTKEFKTLLENQDMNGIADYLQSKISPTAGAEPLANANAALRLLRTEGRIYQQYMADATPDDRQAIAFYMSRKYNQESPDAVTNSYTEDYNKRLNAMFTYAVKDNNGVVKSKEIAPRMAVFFNTDNNKKQLLDNLKAKGITESDFNKYGLSITTVNGKEALIVPKNMQNFNNVADAIYGVTSGFFETPIHYDLLNDNNEVMPRAYGADMSFQGTRGDFARLSSTAGTIKSAEDITRKYIKDKTMTMTLQGLPYDDYANAALLNLVETGQISTEQYNIEKDRFKESVKRGLVTDVTSLDNFAVYNLSKDGKLVEADDIEDVKEALLDGIAQDSYEAAASASPDGVGFGTIITLLPKAPSGNNKEIKSMQVYIDGLNTSRAAQIVANHPEQLYLREYQRFRGMGVPIDDLMGNSINYTDDVTDTRRFIATRYYQEVLSGLDTLKKRGAQLTDEDRANLTADIMRYTGINPNSSDYTTAASIISSKLYDYYYPNR